MTTSDASAQTIPPQPPVRFRLPDPPERRPDDVTSYDQIHLPGNAHFLAQHLGNRATTLVAVERYVVAAPHIGGGAIRRVPDLLIALDVDPQAYRNRNGYIVSEQGKPPDFVLEVASPSTGNNEDTGPRRDDYATLGIPEYWRFDETGEYHGTRLAGDRLAQGVYHPIPIDELPDGSLPGYSTALNLYLRWEAGTLGWYDPATGRRIATFEAERRKRIAAETRAEAERAGRIAAERRASAAEAHIRELEDLLHRRGND